LCRVSVKLITHPTVLAKSVMKDIEVPVISPLLNPNGTHPAIGTKV
jgi:hypothetical protein